MMRTVLRIKHRSLAWLACVAMTLFLAPPSGLHAQTLEDALKSTYLTNPTLEAQRANLRSTTELVAEALGDWRPTLAIESAVETSWADRSSSRASSTTDSDVALVVEQNLFRGGETMASIRQSEQLVLYERARLAAIEQDVLLDAVEAYADLVNAREILDLAEENVRRLRDQRLATRKRFKAGQVTGTDVAQSEARFAEAKAERDLANSAVGSSVATFQSIIRQDPSVLATPPALRLEPSSEADAQAVAKAGNPTIMAARYRLAAAEADIGVARAALFPTLDLEADVGYADQQDIDSRSGAQAAIGLQLRVPLYQGGGDHARVRRAKQDVRERDHEVEAAIRSVYAETADAWQDLVGARARIDGFEQQVEAAQIALDGAAKEALVGQRTLLDVLDLESDLFQAKVDVADARRDEIVASYQLRAALGQLTAEHLNLPVERYDAERYHDENRGRLFGLGD